MPAARRDGPVHQQHIAVEDAGVLHGLAPGAHEEGGLWMLDQARGQVDALGTQVLCG
jgi:hypothetical protein